MSGPSGPSRSSSGSPPRARASTPPATSCARTPPAVAGPSSPASASTRSWRRSDAHRVTGGLFDPRVLRVLTSYGYDTSLPFESRRLDLPAAPAKVTRRRGFGSRTWRPRFDADRLAVRVGREPIDLGGIGKGLAVRWASRRSCAAPARPCSSRPAATSWRSAPGTDGEGWMIAVENPLGGDEPVAVLRVQRPRGGDVVDPDPLLDRRRHRGAPHHRPAHRPSRRGRPRVGHGGRRGPGDVRGLEQEPVRHRTCGHPRRGRRARPRRRCGWTAAVASAPAVRCAPTSIGRCPVSRELTALASASSATRSPPAPASSCSSPGSAALTSWLVGMGITSVVGDRMAPWILGRAAGITSYLLLVALTLFGLVLSHPSRARWRRPSAATRIRAHVSLSVFTLVFTVLHIVVLATDKYAGVGWWGTFVPMGSTYRPLPVTLGRHRALRRSRGGPHRGARRSHLAPGLVADPQGRHRVARPRVAARHPRRHRHPGDPRDVRRSPAASSCSWP